MAPDESPSATTESVGGGVLDSAVMVLVEVEVVMVVGDGVVSPAVAVLPVGWVASVTVVGFVSTDDDAAEVSIGVGSEVTVDSSVIGPGVCSGVLCAPHRTTVSGETKHR